MQYDELYKAFQDSPKTVGLTLAEESTGIARIVLEDGTTYIMPNLVYLFWDAMRKTHRLSSMRFLNLLGISLHDSKTLFHA